MAPARVVGRGSRLRSRQALPLWQRLATEHADALQLSGPEWVKRSQALRHFTWRWRWWTALRGEQLRFLLLRTSPLTWLRCATVPTDLSDLAWTGDLATDRTVDVRGRGPPPVGVRAATRHVSRSRAARAVGRPSLSGHVAWPPNLPGPRKQCTRSRSHPASTRCPRGTLLFGNRRLEIGAGYGRTAYVLLSVFPGSTYTIVDIEPADPSPAGTSRNCLLHNDCVSCARKRRQGSPADPWMSLSQSPHFRR